MRLGNSTSCKKPLQVLNTKKYTETPTQEHISGGRFVTY